MAKSPRKAAGKGKSAKSSQTPARAGKSKKSVPQKSSIPAPRPYGGKKLSSYSFHRDRRFSIVSSSSSDSIDDAVTTGNATNARGASHQSDSESSLTAMSENDEQSHLRKGSVFFHKNPPSRRPMGKSTKSLKKTLPRTHGGSAAYDSDDSDDSSDSNSGSANRSGNIVELNMEDENNDYNSDSDASDNGNATSSRPYIAGLDAMMDTNRGFYTSAFASDSDSDSDSDDNDNDNDDNNSSDSSSSDDSEVDFVRLQAERAKSRKSLKSLKHNQHHQNNASEKKRRKSDFRRKSEVALPEDINFKFEFDGSANSDAIEEEEDSEIDAPTGSAVPGADVENESEDIGEEVSGESNSGNTNLNVHLDEPLLDVPKINEDELNSDDEYDFDDNDLLATLQADNDIDEFITGDGGQETGEKSLARDRQSSVSSFNEDETADPFLEEEEKYLVNEFEQNGFDDENIDNSAGLDAARSINSLHNNNEDMVLQYHSFSERGSDDNNDHDDDDDGYIDDDEDDDDDVDDYIDLIDFGNSLFSSKTGELDDPEPIKESKDSSHHEKAAKAKKAEKAEKAQKRERHRLKALGLLDNNDDDDDDLYLWNYFFSSGNEDDDDDIDLDDAARESETDPYDVEEQLILEEIFRQEKEAQQQKKDREFSLGPASQDQPEYDSGESTDVDLSLPPALKRNHVGSKMAKEVLSSKTADYRPPVLGTWVAIESKPFGIIDGLSTRLLTGGGGGATLGAPGGGNFQNSNNGNGNNGSMSLASQAAKHPRGKGWKSIGLPGNNVGGKTESGEDLAIELDELLNISELDNDDENDIRIWRDFNNRKKRVPLGAFRNKSHLHQPVFVPEPMSGFSTSKMNNDFNNNINHNNHTNNHQELLLLLGSQDQSSKLRRRKASMADAVSEGYRPTKSGLFSENVLNGVEEVLGDDKDFMALIKGL